MLNEKIDNRLQHDQNGFQCEINEELSEDDREIDVVEDMDIDIIDGFQFLSFSTYEEMMREDAKHRIERATYLKRLDEKNGVFCEETVIESPRIKPLFYSKGCKKVAITFCKNTVAEHTSLTQRKGRDTNIQDDSIVDSQSTIPDDDCIPKSGFIKKSTTKKHMDNHGIHSLLSISTTLNSLESTNNNEAQDAFCPDLYTEQENSSLMNLEETAGYSEMIEPVSSKSRKMSSRRKSNEIIENGENHDPEAEQIHRKISATDIEKVDQKKNDILPESPIIEQDIPNPIVIPRKLSDESPVPMNPSSTSFKLKTRSKFRETKVHSSSYNTRVGKQDHSCLNKSLSPVLTNNSSKRFTLKTRSKFRETKCNPSLDNTGLGKQECSSLLKNVSKLETLTKNKSSQENNPNSNKFENRTNLKNDNNSVNEENFVWKIPESVAGSRYRVKNKINQQKMSMQKDTPRRNIKKLGQRELNPLLKIANEYLGSQFQNKMDDLTMIRRIEIDANGWVTGPGGFTIGFNPTTNYRPSARHSKRLALMKIESEPNTLISGESITADHCVELNDIKTVLPKVRHLVNWKPCIKGKRLIIEGDLLDESGHPYSLDFGRFVTSKMIVRHSNFQFRSKNATYELKGKTTVSQDLPNFVIEAFCNGIPRCWKVFLNHWRHFVKEMQILPGVLKFKMLKSVEDIDLEDEDQKSNISCWKSVVQRQLTQS